MPKKKYPKITKKDLEEGVKKWKEENEWEEFEDEIHFVGEVETCQDDVESLELERNNFPNLVIKYIGEERTKILIKARKGEIVIKKLEV